jgi:peptidoglycan/xylan/chitin deacetylase (PgdA/CDA1 family)
MKALTALQAAMLLAVSWAPGLAAGAPHGFERNPAAGRVAALSFDASGASTAFDRLLDGLASRHVRGTFFITGAWAQENPGLVIKLRRAGHEVANSTWDQQALAKLSDDALASQIKRTNRLLSSLLGHAPAPLFRAPAGPRDARVLRIVTSLGLQPVSWSLDSCDSLPGRNTPQHVFDALVLAKDDELDGVVILLHVGEPATAEALPYAINALRERGFQFVTVSELMKRRDNGTDRIAWSPASTGDLSADEAWPAEDRNLLKMATAP